MKEPNIKKLKNNDISKLVSFEADWALAESWPRPSKSRTFILCTFYAVRVAI